jgi:glutamate synthase (NADPH/NADH)
MKSDKFGEKLERLYPIVETGGSDSAAFDNVLELLVINGVLFVLVFASSSFL